MAEGCCSLECGARTIGWLQVANGCLLILYEVVTLLIVIEKEAGPVIYISQTKNTTNVHFNETSLQVQEEVEAAKTIAVLVGIILIFFYAMMIAIAGALLTGIRKHKPKLVRIWLVANGVGLCLIGGFILIELGAMLLANDPGSLTMQIIWLVLYIVQVWVVNSYYEEMKDQMVPAY